MRALALIARWAVFAVLVACTSDDSHPCADAGCARDAAVVDGAAEVDAGSRRDAGAAGAGEEPYTECATAQDCPVPPGLLPCVSCEDGSQSCMEAVCVAHLCATRVARPCPEREAELRCSTDAECARTPCAVKCQGDARDACLRATCRGGLCLPVRSTCGLQLEPCTEGTRAGIECGACGAAGGCEFEVLGCFQTCDKAADCPADEACRDGLCQFVSDCD